jgi:hypothetical protein
VKLSLLSSSEVMNEYNYASILPHASMACTGATFILYTVTSRVKSFRTYVVYSHTQYIKSIAQNRTSDAEDVLQFLYSQDQRFTRVKSCCNLEEKRP